MLWSGVNRGSSTLVPLLINDKLVEELEKYARLQDDYFKDLEPPPDASVRGAAGYPAYSLPWVPLLVPVNRMLENAHRLRETIDGIPARMICDVRKMSVWTTSRSESAR